MKGFFVSQIIPTLMVKVNQLECNVIVDTGFTGEIMLPSGIIKRLKLSRIGKEDYLTADAHKYDADLYLGSIEWFGSPRAVIILECPANIMLFGMGLLRHCKMTLCPKQNCLELEKI